MSTPPPAPGWAPSRQGQFQTVARNASARYVALLTDMGIGLLTLPFNLAYLGTAEYGLWVLLASVTVHFSAFDLGYSGAIVKFIAQYRAHVNAKALNEIASTMFVAFFAIGILVYCLLAGVAFNLEHLFKITAEQASVGKWILLIIGLHVMLNFPFSVFGAVTSGFQRHDINSVAAVGTSIVAALANVIVVLSGGTLVTLVACTTGVRMAAYLIYRANAYHVFPELRVRPSLFRKERLKEVTGFSVYTSIIDWANKLNYQLDEIVIGAMLGAGAVAVWAPAERIISGTQRLTNQVNGILFPLVVDSDQSQQQERLRQILIQGTRFSLAMVVPISAALIVLADPLIRAWLGERAEAVAGAIPVIQILAVAVAIRVGDATGTTVLKGAGSHRMLAFVNLGTGVVNIVLSALLIGPFGLVGVAYGTLIPIAFTATFILFPAACRRVGVGWTHAVIHGVVPAVWPALVSGTFLWFTRDHVPGTLIGVLGETAAGGIIYLVLFFGVAVGREDRTLYMAKLREMLARQPKAPRTPKTPVADVVAGGR